MVAGLSRRCDAVEWDEDGRAGAVDQQVAQEPVVDRGVADERRVGRVGQREDQQVEMSGILGHRGPKTPKPQNPKTP